jgi:pyruvate/2-oxoglutarate/acetoin dehydrogenase E1 component
MLGVGDALRADPRVFVYGEDVGGNYGNAFLLLKPLLKEFGDRLINSPLGESAVLGVCIGAAIAGQRPIGEMQFNDFVATGFNQLVNNAAKMRYRWGGTSYGTPMVVRMPGAVCGTRGRTIRRIRRRGSTTPPASRLCAVDASRRAGAHGVRRRRSGPGAVLRAHRALPGPANQANAVRRSTEPIPLGRAALRRAGEDLAIISYGAFVHTACGSRQSWHTTASRRACWISARWRRWIAKRVSRSRAAATRC